MPSLGRWPGPAGERPESGHALLKVCGCESEGPRGCRPAVPGGFSRDRALPVHPRGDARSSRTTAGPRSQGAPAECKPRGPACESGRVSPPLFPSRAEKRGQEGGQRAQNSGQQVQQPAALSLLRSELGPHGSGRAARAALRVQPQNSAPQEGLSILPAHAGGQDADEGLARPAGVPGAGPGWRRPRLLLGAGPDMWLAPLPLLRSPDAAR